MVTEHVMSIRISKQQYFRKFFEQKNKNKVLFALGCPHICG